jgi:hypothetical protein
MSESKEKNQPPKLLSREIIQSLRNHETMLVTTRDGSQFEVELRGLTELELATASQEAGLTLNELTKKHASKDFELDAAGIKKLRFLHEVISSAIESEPKLGPGEIDLAFNASERARIFNKVIELSPILKAEEPTP